MLGRPPGEKSTLNNHSVALPEDKEGKEYVPSKEPVMHTRKGVIIPVSHSRTLNGSPLPHA
jgi:hypothetical protein